jgi:hypothetical protein
MNKPPIVIVRDSVAFDIADTPQEVVAAPEAELRISEQMKVAHEVMRRSAELFKALAKR